MVLGSAMEIPLFKIMGTVFLVPIAFEQWGVIYLFNKHLLNISMLSLSLGVKGWEGEHGGYFLAFLGLPLC